MPLDEFAKLLTRPRGAVRRDTATPSPGQGVQFGHASAGNAHFVLTADFTRQEEIDRFMAFTEDSVALVADELNGSLKAEHGTGRAMAPFVSREWGDKAYSLMKRIKKLVDPGRPAQSRRAHQRRPRHRKQEHKAHATGLAADRQVHRMRFLRARLPEPPRDAHAPRAHPGLAQARRAARKRRRHRRRGAVAPVPATRGSTPAPPTACAGRSAPSGSTSPSTPPNCAPNATTRPRRPSARCSRVATARSRGSHGAVSPWGCSPTGPTRWRVLTRAVHKLVPFSPVWSPAIGKSPPPCSGPSPRPRSSTSPPV